MSPHDFMSAHEFFTVLGILMAWVVMVLICSVKYPGE